MRKMVKRRISSIMLVCSLVIGGMQSPNAAYAKEKKDIIKETKVEEQKSTKNNMLSDEIKILEEAKELESSQVPEKSKGPESSQVPEESKSPESSQVPEKSKGPESSQVPEETKNPEVSQAPEETREPIESQEPIETLKPEQTKLPSMKYQVEKKGDKQILVSWNKVAQAVSYQAIIERPNGVTEKTVTTKNQKQFSVEPGKQHKVTLVAFDNTGEKIAETKNIKLCIPTKVSDISFTRTGSKDMKLKWKKSEGADTYYIYRKEGTKNYKLVKKLKQLSWKDKNLKKAMTYTYKIVSVNTKNTEAIMGKEKIEKIKIKDFVSTGHQKYSYSEMKEDIEGLQKLYEEYCSYQIIGKSADNRNIYEVVVGNPSAKKTMLVVSNLHAREYMTAQLCMKQIEEYLKNYNGTVSGIKVSSVLNEVCVRYIPMGNPDGVTISQYGISKIRNASLRAKLKKMPGSSHTSTWKSNARGVDLNRNYPVSYRSNHGTRGSSGYTGTSAASEPETKAIIKWIDQTEKKCKIKGVVNYHAMGRIVFGSCATASIRGTTTKMYNLARNITGYASSAGYGSGSPSIGNLREYIMYKRAIPSITLEIGSISCPVPIWQFSAEWTKNKSVVLREAKLFVS